MFYLFFTTQFLPNLQYLDHLILLNKETKARITLVIDIPDIKFIFQHHGRLKMILKLTLLLFLALLIYQIEK